MLYPYSASALDLTVPSVFADHMILQRDQAVPVWGTADPGSTVTVEFAGQSGLDIAAADGTWRVNLDAMPASSESRILKVSAKKADDGKALGFSDVLVGEIWLCGGQSNMYRPFRMLVSPAVDSFHEPTADYLRREVATANDPLLRQYRVGPDISALSEKSQGRGTWSKAITGEVKEISATAYFFGRELRRELDVPVALLSCNLGGTRIESWIPPQACDADKDLKDYFNRELAAHKKQLEQWDDAREQVRYKQAMTAWRQAKHEGSKVPKKPVIVENPSRDKQVPGALFNGMVRPLIPYAIKGAIWYQGESNSNYFPEEYGSRFVSLINAWRTAWGQEKYYFYWCQLAAYKAANDLPKGDEDTWALVQDGQSHALNEPDTGMAVLNDIGDARDVHPKNKVDAGRRLALLALNQAYGKDLVSSGPLFKDAKLTGSRVMVTFDHVGSGLMTGQKHLMDPPIQVDEPLKRFQICGSDRVWKWGHAKIASKDTVEVWHEAVPQPTEVRYAWSSNPEGANFYNREGLPASLFKTKNPLSK